ncbi:MAG: hypothetical protein M1347_05075 [Chloroflexi bacterium]|nr:hypothetical protein [Chloroflexota bacterium]
MIKEPQQRPPLYLLTGLAVGLLAGLILAWILWPARVIGVSPASLDEPYKEQYRLMASLAFAASGDLGRAQARIALLQDSDPVRALTTQAQVALANSATQREARALAGLASALQGFVTDQAATAQAINTPDLTRQDQVSTPFESGAESASYKLQDQELVCDSVDTPPYLKIFVFDANANPQAGVQLVLKSEEDTADLSTGLHPEMSPGYAEFILTPRVVYSLSINGDEMMGGIQAAACETESGEPAWGSWLLLFNAEP